MLIFSLLISSVLCIFSEISMSNNSSIAIFPYPYILWMDGILLERIFMDLKLMFNVLEDQHLMGKCFIFE